MYLDRRMLANNDWRIAGTTLAAIGGGILTVRRANLGAPHGHLHQLSADSPLCLCDLWSGPRPPGPGQRGGGGGPGGPALDPGWWMDVPALGVHEARPDRCPGALLRGSQGALGAPAPLGDPRPGGAAPS